MREYGLRLWWYGQGLAEKHRNDLSAFFIELPPVQQKKIIFENPQIKLIN